jgi:hypothetical protein
MLPGKVTLTQLVSTSTRPTSVPGGVAHRSPPTRVGDAHPGEAQLNAVLKVVVIDDGKVIQRWQSRARWDGPLPVRWAAVRGGGGWRWDSADARSLKVQTDERGRGGKPVDAWAASSADQIVVYVRAIDDVAVDADAEADEKLADDFERELGLEPGADLPDGDDSPDRPGGEPLGGRGEAGGERDARTGPDTRTGGTGPGGEAARPEGKGKGSEDGHTAGGSEAGSRDGQQGGAEEGMYGGEGERGDRGVPSAVALFGGLVSVPAALRGLVELALIASSGDVTGAGKALFKKGLGKLASVAALRQMVAQEARVAAMRETQAAMRSLATSKKTAAAFAKLTEAEQQRLMRITYWELQRKYFQGYLAAAREAKAEATALLRNAPGASGAQAKLRSAEMAEEAATVQPVAGRLPQNHELAGKPFPKDQLPAAYRQQGLWFKATGHPDFEPFALTLPNGQKYVEIAYTGSRSGDFAAANAKAGFQRMPAGYTWHHSEELGRMYLVPKNLHDAVKHTGGVATNKHVTGDIAYGR